MTWRPLVLAYLIFRVVACPILCGSTPHHAYSQSFQTWASRGAEGCRHHDGGDMKDPAQPSPEHGPCFCDGVDLHCADSPIEDDPGDLLLVLIDPFVASQPWIQAETMEGPGAAGEPGGQDRSMAPPRADLQNFRC